MMFLPSSLCALALCVIINSSSGTPINSVRAPGTAAAVAWSSLRCPEAGGGGGGTNLPTPTYGTEIAVFQVCSQVVIDAPPAAVYHALLDFQSYPRWNSFVTDVALPADVAQTPDDLYVGAVTTFTTQGILPAVNTTSTEVVTAMEPALPGGGHALVAWRSDDGAGGLLHRAEHPTVLVDLGDGKTLSVSYEPYYAGLLTAELKLLKPRLQELFEQQNRNLKAYVEGL